MSTILKSKIALIALTAIVVISVGAAVGFTLNTNPTNSNTPSPQATTPSFSPNPTNTKTPTPSPQTTDARNNSAEYTITVPVEFAFGLEDRKNDWGTGGELFTVIAFFAWEPATYARQYHVTIHMNGHPVQPHYWGQIENDAFHSFNKTTLPTLIDGTTYILANDEASQGEINYYGPYNAFQKQFQVDKVGNRHFMSIGAISWWFDQKNMPDQITKDQLMANYTAICQDSFIEWTATVRAST